MIWFDTTNIDALLDPVAELNGDSTIDMNAQDGEWAIPTLAEFGPVVPFFKHFLTWLIIVRCAFGVDAAQISIHCELSFVADGE